MAAVAAPNLQHEEHGITPREHAQRTGVSLQTVHPLLAWSDSVPSDSREVLDYFPAE